MSPAPIRVMCVDDNKLLASAIQRCLLHQPRLEWAGWVSSMEHVCPSIDAAAAAPNVVLLDIDMPGGDAFELVRTLAERHPKIRVVMFSGHVRAGYIDRAVDAGAWGYVSKNDGAQEMIRAIERVAEGQFVMTGEALRELGRPQSLTSTSTPAQ